MVAARGARPLTAVAAEMGLTYHAISGLERGRSGPSGATALKLARWLGWTVEDVLIAATKPVRPGESAGS